MNRSEVYTIINNERDYQDSLGPERVARKVHSICEELLLLRQYLDKAEKAWMNHPCPEGGTLALDEIRKVTALGVRCMENHGARPRPAHPHMQTIPSQPEAKLQLTPQTAIIVRHNAAPDAQNRYAASLRGTSIVGLGDTEHEAITNALGVVQDLEYFRSNILGTVGKHIHGLIEQCQSST